MIGAQTDMAAVLCPPYADRLRTPNLAQKRPVIVRMRSELTGPTSAFGLRALRVSGLRLPIARCELVFQAPGDHVFGGNPHLAGRLVDTCASSDHECPR